MDTRTRRELKRQLGSKVMQHPYMKRMKRNLKEAGKLATEVYRLDGETPDGHLYFDVYTMRKWTMAKVNVVGTFLNWERAEHLVTSGAVDPEWIRDHTISRTMEPVIIGVGACANGSDQVLDGAHRYVAYALAATAMGLQGAPLPMPAYFLEREQWRRFLIPNFIAKALGFDEAHEREPGDWASAA